MSRPLASGLRLGSGAARGPEEVRDEHSLPAAAATAAYRSFAAPVRPGPAVDAADLCPAERGRGNARSGAAARCGRRVPAHDVADRADTISRSVLLLTDGRGRSASKVTLGGLCFGFVGGAA